MKRTIAKGVLSEISEDEAHFISPWKVVIKGEGDDRKVRPCLDVSGTLNPWTPNVPFKLGVVRDLSKLAKPRGWMAKADLGDFFYSFKIHPEHRKYFAVRDPITNKVYQFNRLPFGYKLSPLVCCGFSDLVANQLRREGIKVIWYVDDALVIADSEAACRKGMERLRELVTALGLQYAPHKAEGPAQRMVFLGVEISLLPGKECYRLPLDKVQKTLGEVERFLSTYQVEDEVHAMEIAQVCGKLAFAAQVIRPGAAYLRRIYDVLKGCVVNWKTGRVTCAGRERSIIISPGLIKDLSWWGQNLELCNHSLVWPRGELKFAAHRIGGTDASDWGAGIVLERSGGREEYQIRWSRWEKCCNTSLGENYAL